MNRKVIIISIAIALCIPSYIICMDLPKTPQEQYQAKCLEIRAQQKSKLEAYTAPAINKDFVQEKTVFEQKLGRYWIYLNAKKQILLSRIQRKFNINEEIWQSCMKTMCEVEQFNRANQHLPLPNIVHDTAIPEDLLFPITGCLKKMNINPQRINICGKTNKSYMYSFKVPMPHLYKLATPYAKKGKNIAPAPFIISSENIRPGKIVINLDIFEKMDSFNQAALCIRMADNIAQNSSLMSEVIATFEPLLITKPGTITNSKQFKELNIFNIKHLPILLPCITDSITTMCMLQLQSDCFDPDFTSQDYKLLAKIDRYWKSLEWIDQQQKNMEIVKKIYTCL